MQQNIGLQPRKSLDSLERCHECPSLCALQLVTPTLNRPDLPYLQNVGLFGLKNSVIALFSKIVKFPTNSHLILDLGDVFTHATSGVFPFPFNS